MVYLRLEGLGIFFSHLIPLKPFGQKQNLPITVRFTLWINSLIKQNAPFLQGWSEQSLQGKKIIHKLNILIIINLFSHFSGFIASLAPLFY
jgi:hypothetical protein